MGFDSLGRLAVVGVTILILFLAYGSQVLFFFLEPGPLNFRDRLVFNALVLCIFVCYFRSCFTNPGYVPREWKGEDQSEGGTSEAPKPKRRWCRKCQVYKPPRAHHCKTCARCIPKMDHHCPWTSSCVSHRVMPHFMRFLFYAVLTMSYLALMLFDRVVVIWESRNLPFYLGPSVAAMIALLIICTTNFVTLFAVGLLFIRNVWCLATNVTTIEGWEIERHESLVRRARARGGYVDDANGQRVHVQKQEFPYDIGIWKNTDQGMGGSIFSWLWPFSRTPKNDDGLSFETNGFEDPAIGWPPPEPYRTRRGYATPSQSDLTSPLLQDNYVEAFRERQQQDFRRRGARAIAEEQLDEPDLPNHPGLPKDALLSGVRGTIKSASAWKDSDGDRLQDFGVDEEIDFYDGDGDRDDDDIPLAQLLHSRQNPRIA